MRPVLTISQADAQLSATQPVRAQWTGVQGRVPPHDHDYHEICVMLNGSAIHRTSAGDRTKITPGHAIVVPPGGVHAFDELKDFYVVNVYYLAEWLASDLATLWAEPGLVPLFLSESVIGPATHSAQPVQFTLTPDELAAITYDLGDIEKESKTAHASAALIRAAFIKALVRLTRAAARVSPQISRQRREIWLAIQQIERLVANAEPLDVEALAESVLLSSDYLGKIFRNSLGRSINDYFQFRRVQRACQLLTDPQRSVTDVAIELGYADTPHLCRMFKRYRQMTPNAYRRMYGPFAISG